MDLISAIGAASQVANSQVLWSILCITLAGYVLRRSEKQEERLIVNLESLTRSQLEQANTMKQVSETLNKVEGRMDRMEKHVYRDKTGNTNNVVAGGT